MSRHHHPPQRLPLQPFNEQVYSTPCCPAAAAAPSAAAMVVPSEPIQPPNHIPRGRRDTKLVLLPGSHHQVSQVPVIISHDGCIYWLRRQLCEEKDRTRIWKAYPLQHVTNPRGQLFWKPILSQPVVVKESLLSAEPFYGRGEDALTEMAAMLLLEKPQDHGVIRLIDYFMDADSSHGQILYTVLPYLEGDDAFNLIKKTNGGQGLDEAVVKAIVAQTVSSLLYLKHHYRLRHGDVSPENIMVDTKTFKTTLIDLGMVEKVPKPLNQEQHGDVVLVKGRPYRGKRQYMSNEIYLGKDHDPFAADVWSLGTVIYVMLTGCALYNAPKDDVFAYLQRPGGVRRLIDLREAKGYVVPISEEAKDLICGCLHPDPSGRLSLEDIIDHCWLGKDLTPPPSPSSISSSTMTTPLFPTSVSMCNESSCAPTLPTGDNLTCDEEMDMSS